MIAGPDLAGAYMEPDEFFTYLRGRLREHFVADPREAAPRVATLDRLRDPDGRFRLTEVYCTADTWQPTVLEMMARAGVILLDLREYAGTRLGTPGGLAGRRCRGIPAYSGRRSFPTSSLSRSS